MRPIILSVPSILTSNTGRPDDLPPLDGSDELDGQGDGDARLGTRREEFDVEELPDEEDRPDKNAA